jgi:hypothetical protein
VKPDRVRKHKAGECEKAAGNADFRPFDQDRRFHAERVAIGDRNAKAEHPAPGRQIGNSHVPAVVGAMFGLNRLQPLSGFRIGKRHRHGLGRQRALFDRLKLDRDVHRPGASRRNRDIGHRFLGVEMREEIVVAGSGRRSCRQARRPTKAEDA